MTADRTAPPPRRRALVTGGASGIGWAICRALADGGARCAIADVKLERARERAAELGPEHVALGIDLARLNDARALPAAAAMELGGLDLVVNNAGITDTSGRRISEIPADEFDRLVAVNLGSMEAICQSAQRLMGPGGVVVNLASGAAYRPLALRGAYSATKAGVLALTAAMDRRAAPLGQRVAAVAPGFVRTELVESLVAEGRLDLEAAAARIPMGRLGTPEDIAQAVVFLVSPGGAVMAGRCLSVDGGTVAAGGAAPFTAPADAGHGSAGPVTLIGDDEMIDRVLAGADTGTEVARASSEAELPQAPGAVIDLRGLAPASSARALSRTHRLVAALDATEAGGKVPLLVCLRDAGGAGISEAAMGMLSQTLALERAAAGGRVNALSWAGEDVTGLLDLGRWLCGPEARYVTGQIVEAGGRRGIEAAGEEEGNDPVRQDMRTDG